MDMCECILLFEHRLMGLTDAVHVLLGTLHAEAGEAQIVMYHLVHIRSCGQWGIPSSLPRSQTWRGAWAVEMTGRRGVRCGNGDGAAIAISAVSAQRSALSAGCRRLDGRPNAGASPPLVGVRTSGSGRGIVPAVALAKRAYQVVLTGRHEIHVSLGQSRRRAEEVRGARGQQASVGGGRI